MLQIYLPLTHRDRYPLHCPSLHSISPSSVRVKPAAHFTVILLPCLYRSSVGLYEPNLMEGGGLQELGSEDGFRVGVLGGGAEIGQN